MRRTLKVMLIILVLTFISDRLVGIVASYLYDHSSDKYSYALNTCDSEIVLLGSSAVEGGFNSLKIQDSLNKSCYNLGVPGNNIYANYCILHTIIQQNNIPNTIIMDLTVADYNDIAGWNTELISTCHSLYGKIDSVRCFINTYSDDKYVKYKLQSHVYRYNSQLSTFFKRFTDRSQNGFLPLHGVYANEMEISTTSFSLDKTKILFIEKIINICNSNDIMLYITFSPRFSVIENDSQNIEKMKDILKNYDCTVLDYSHREELMIRTLFTDIGHLNSVGAEIYTNILIQDIK